MSMTAQTTSSHSHKLVADSINTPALGDSSNTEKSKGNKEVSKATLMEEIYALLLLVGVNMSKVQTAAAGNQQDSTTISQAISAALKSQAQNYIDEANKQMKAEEKQKKLAPWLKLLEVVAVVVGAVISFATGGLASLAVFALVTAFTLSPLMNKAVSGISDVLQDMGVPSSVAKIIAEVYVIVATTVITCNLESALTSLAAPATDAVEDGIEMTNMAVDDALPQANTETENTLSNLTQDAEDQEKTVFQKAKDVFQKTRDFINEKSPLTFVSSTAFVSTLTQTNVVNQIISETKWGKDDEKKAAVVSALIEAVLAIAAFACAGSPSGVSGLAESAVSKLPESIQSSIKTIMSIMQKVLDLLETTSLQTGLRWGQVAITTATSGTEIASGVYQIQDGQAIQSIAGLQSDISFLTQFTGILSNLSTEHQKTLQSVIATNEQASEINFSADSQAAINIQQNV